MIAEETIRDRFKVRSGQVAVTAGNLLLVLCNPVQPVA